MDLALFFAQTRLRAALSVSLLLALSFVVTGFVASAYRRERRSLGELHYDRAQSLVKQSRLDDGIEEYRKALIFSPDKTEYRLSLATALTDAGRLDEAQRHLEQLLQEDPTNGVINLMLARVALRQGHVQLGIEYYQRAVYEYWPAAEIEERRRARWELITQLGKTGRRNEAVGELMQLYANAPPDPSQKARIGFMLLKYGATSEASQVFHDLVRDAPEEQEAHRGLGDVYFSSGNLVSARHEFQRALRLDPDDHESRDALALTNAAIELDAALPGITSEERFRRSQNLLNRVVAHLEQCSSSDAPQSELSAAQKMLRIKHSADADIGLELQSEAQQLWKNRAQFCGPTSTPDQALEVALARVGHE